MSRWQARLAHRAVGGVQEEAGEDCPTLQGSAMACLFGGVGTCQRNFRTLAPVKYPIIFLVSSFNFELGDLM